MTTVQKTAVQWLGLLKECAQEADQMSRHYFEKSIKIETKKDRTLVTEADIAIERKIRDQVKHIDPDLAVLGEEFGSCSTDSTKKLIIDPIDGTVNFIRGIPIFASLLAIEVEGIIVAGLVSNPITGDRYMAAQNQGATFNGKPIHVSSISHLSDSQAFYGSLYGSEATGLPVQKIMNLLSRTKRQRGIGDFLMHLWVSRGYGEFAFDVNLNPWDLAPLGLIVEESGGVVSTLSGQPFSIYQPTILSSNGFFHDEIASLINA